MEQIKRKINLIVVHCSATREDKNYSPKQLEREHKARGFNSAGYNYYITKDGVIHPMRPLDVIPAHAKGYNANSIGVCYEGGIDKNGKAADTRTEQQKESLIELLMALVTEFPDAKICGHRDLSPDLNGDGKITSNEWTKMCPCFDAIEEYKNI